jgi:hypothetical protein
VPAVLTLALGLEFSGIGVFAVAVISHQLSNNLLDYINRTQLFVSCFLYLGPGTAWVVSSVLFWKGRWRTAIPLTVVGVLIPVILFCILGF